MAKVMVFILIVFAFIWQSCGTQKRVSQKDFDINGVYETVKLKDTITVMVLGYVPVKECNDSIHFYSTCFGLNVKTDEIIKIYTECNTDTTISKGNIIQVTPVKTQENTNYNKVVNTIMIKEIREYKYSPLYKLQVKTTYGTLVKL